MLNDRDELSWIPNERFASEADRFATYRLTDLYQENEVEYKASLATLLKRFTSRESLEADGVARLADLAAGHLDLESLALDDAEAALLARNPYHQSFPNLLGGGQSALIQLSTFRRWAESDAPTVAVEIEGVLRGTEPLAERFDRFLTSAQEAYGRLFAQGQLRAREVPRVSPQIPAILLSLTDPNTYGLFRPAVYQLSADSFDYPLKLAGSTGAKYTATTAMLAAFRDALRDAGCPVDDLLEVHNLLWIRAKYPDWSGMGVDHWDDGDFDAMRTDQPQDRAKIGIIQAKLEKIGAAFRIELHDRTGRDFRASILGLYPPSRRAWPWLNVALGEPRFGSQPTARPQLNVEVGAEGLDVFYSIDLRATTGAAAAVRARVRERRGDPALLEGAVAAGYVEAQEDEAGRYMVRRRVPRATAIGWAGLGIDELAAELDLLLPIYEAMAAEPPPPQGPTKHGDNVDPRFKELASALEDRGQVILYGPPGTGKTWTAYRFALWWLTKHWGGDADAVLADEARIRAADKRFARAQRERRTWWVVANPTQWSWAQLFKEGTVEYRYGRLQRNYELIQPGDLVIGYQANPDKRVMALARIAQTLHEASDGQQRITLDQGMPVANGLTYEELLADPVLSVSEPARFRNQGTLFRLTGTEADLVLARLAERDPSLPELEADDPSGGVGPLTRITFHPTYGYEDFVEGFRPVPTTTGQLSLELTPGVFKRVCQAARTDAEHRPYLLLIDEINRGNIPKIFGELITLIERDKRDQSAVLPQSGDPFAVPPNVFLVGTMNTADRSIRLLDAALRRRFSFMELMPDSTTLGDARIGDLELAHFLDELNLRITKGHGREKQVGHSFLLDGGKPITTTDQFAARFRREILPLLQEYAYDDFRELGDYLGPDLIDAELQRVTVADLTPDALVSALAVEYGGAKNSDVAEVG